MNIQHSSASTRAFGFVGSGGDGVITAGAILLDAAARDGLYGFSTRSHGARIRGGEAASYIRLGTAPVDAPADALDVVIALGWKDAERFAAELVVAPDGVVLMAEKAGEPPSFISGATPVDLHFDGARPNVVAAGLAARMAGLRAEALEAAVRSALQKKGQVDENVAAALHGYGLEAEARCLSSERSGGERWRATGNELAAIGALHGGIRFVAGYPITPATGLLEYIAGRLPKVGGALMQAEDELAAIHAVLGAAWAGTPSMTATSGPGLALMVEAIGYGVAAEVPALIVDVMRGGPSTGIPTKSEQADLQMALHGLAGDAPHVVLAPNTVGDCLPTTEWGARLAERLQVPVLVLSDQLLGQARAILAPPGRAPEVGERELADPAAYDEVPYARYALTDDGVSPRAIPGMKGLGHTADGLEHATSGAPSTLPADHQRQLDKRRDKLENYDYGDGWADIEGEGPLAVVCFGSPTGALREALARHRANGGQARLVSIRVLSPAQPERMAAALAGARVVLVVEQTHGAQLLRYLRAEYDLPGRVESHARPGPVPLKPGELYEVLADLVKRERSVA